MADVQFADIFFILLVCAVTFGILHLVNSSKKKKSDSDRVSSAVSRPENHEQQFEDD